VTQEEALAVLDEAFSKIQILRSSRAMSPAHVEFVQTTGFELARLFGGQSAISANFNSIDYQSVGSFVGSVLDFDQELARRIAAAYQRGLDIAEGVLLSARAQLTRHGFDKILTESRIRANGPRVFVSHGTQTPALTKVEQYLRSLRANPIVVVRGPSEGLAVDDLIQKRLDEADCAIILATADEAVGGRHQPRPNVLHEIGLAQQKFPSKIIYLKEAGCDFPSNVQPKVWENFTQENMESAFEKIAKELRAFGFL
jgi:hypothetical protein